MAFCNKCGTKIEEGVNFCPSCGNLVAATSTESQTEQSIKAEAKSTSPSSFYDEKIDAEQNKAMSVLAYFGILVIIPIVAARESKFARFHSNQGLILCIAVIVWTIIYNLLIAIGGLVVYNSFGGLGIVSLLGTLFSLVYVLFGILAIIGIINVLNGKMKELPVIGKYRILK